MRSQGFRLSRGILTVGVFLVLMVFTQSDIFGQDQVDIPDRLMDMTVPELMQQGSELIQQEDWSAARPYYLAVLEKDTTQAGAYVRLTDIEYNLFRLDVAQRYLREAIEIEPNNEEYRTRYNNISQLIQTYQDGLDALRNQDFEQAHSSFDMVLAEYPNFAPALFNKGQVYRAQDNMDEAINYIEQAIDADPGNQNYVSAYANMGRQHFNDGLQAYQRGDLTTAEEEFETSLQIDETLVNAQYMLGIIARRRGNTTEAIDRYRAAIEIDENYERAWLALGIAYESIARDQQALDAYRRATEINANYENAWNRLGLLLTDMENYNEAIQAFQRAIQLEPSESGNYEGLGIAYMQQGQYQLAVEQFTTATGLSSDNENLYYRLSNAYENLGDYAEMRDAAQNALNINSNYAPALVNLGIAQCHLGNGDAAVTAWERASSNAQWRPVAQHQLEVYNTTGECE